MVKTLIGLVKMKKPDYNITELTVGSVYFLGPIVPKKKKLEN